MILFVCYLRPPPLAAGRGRPPTLPLSPARTVQTPRGRAGAGLSQHPGADQCVSLPNSALSGLTLGSETGCGGRIYTTGISERCEPGLRPTEPAVRRPQAHRRVPAFRDHAEPVERMERMLAARRRADHVLTVPLALLNQLTPKKDVSR